MSKGLPGSAAWQIAKEYWISDFCTMKRRLKIGEVTLGNITKKSCRRARVDMKKDKGGRYSGIGGQAVLEGVMMKNKEQYAVAIRFLFMKMRKRKRRRRIRFSTKYLRRKRKTLCLAL